MGKKYIIELPENTHWVQWIMEGTEDHHPYMDFKSVEDLTPYTEPGLEQIRKEAYDNGYHDGCNACYETAKDLMEKKKDEAYKRGLADAWEAARKIHRMPEGDILDLFPDCYASVCTAAQAILKYDASEAITKIKEYEDGKQEIKVGDEVVTDAGNRASVLYENPDGTQVFVFKSDGTAAWWTKSALHRTGRNFLEIAAVLEKMRGEQK